ncbi:Growth arrest and DNA damage-inducible protein GADD45 gamma [Nibea albiflora]|uniref:Growth arrest and DNA damage-inducible protein GADD45 gamma n=1 Tax=Nibea albiflora TaxID=240163 RepID=A0ACB7F9M7_NIBAL|nr:Growth arrest and DNA damage-inducible protein GADD45 gamma [Nibea albiflora]
MQSPGKSLKEALLCAQTEDRLTVGVYESAKIMTDDPDSVSFCVLAMDEEFECDIALQIHFTLIQSFCFDNDISIVRNPAEGSWEDPALEKLHLFCEESRRLNDWVPEISLPER